MILISDSTLRMVPIIGNLVETDSHYQPQRLVENDSHYHSQNGFPQVFHSFSTGKITIKHYHAHF
jgi:Tat protein secretion system quality control protein TatD with DNase activity